MKDTIDVFNVGQKTVGTTSVAVVTLNPPDGNKKGVLIKAYGSDDTAANTVPVFIGGSNVTVDSGFPIAPGEAVTIPYSGGDLYAVASANSQKVAWIAV